MKRLSRRRKTDVGTHTELIKRAEDAIRVARELIERHQAHAEKATRYIHDKLMRFNGEDIDPTI